MTVVWRGSSAGPLQFSVADCVLTGTWLLAGEADITGYGFPFEMAGINTWEASGTVNGSDPYIMQGTDSTFSQVTFAGQTADSEAPFPISSIPWQGLVQVCGQVMGNWDQVIEGAMEGAPLEYSMRSYFTAFATDPSTDLNEQIGSLIQDATRLQRDIPANAVMAAADLGSRAFRGPYGVL